MSLLDVRELRGNPGKQRERRVNVCVPGATDSAGRAQRGRFPDQIRILGRAAVEYGAGGSS